MSNGKSEVARLRAELDRQGEACRALKGLALGTAQHQFITRRMERMGEIHEELKKEIGEEADGLLIQAMEGNARKGVQGLP